MNVKQGDLAYIVPPATMNVGRVVEVVRLIAPIAGYPTWVVRAIGEPIAGISRETKEPCSGRDATCADDALRPINRPGSTEDTDTKEPIGEFA